MAAQTFTRADGTRLAYELLLGAAPIVVFLPGYASDMGGTKAIFLRDACASRGQAMLRLDYSGHGASGGKFEDGSIGIWTEDAARIIEAVTESKNLILVGSSMGGWIALLLALRFAPRVESLLLIAPAPDFTERMVVPNLSAENRHSLARDGVFYEPSKYGAPLPYTRKLLEDGRNHLLLDGNISLICPVQILHGMRDAAVPWQHSLKISECLQSDAVRLTFIKDGDHRLSRDEDLLLLRASLLRLLGEDAA
jgi:pimeloyl-ACP methyl ester carboxylesterase